MRIGKPLVKRPQGGERHNRISDPICGADEDLFIGHTEGEVNPEVSLFMLLGGLMLAYVEFLKPGWVVPGVLGAVAIVWAIANLSRVGISGVRIAVTSAGPAFWLMTIAWAAITAALLRIAIRARRNKLAH